MRSNVAEIKSGIREKLLNSYYAFTPLLLVYFVLELIAGILPATLFSGSDLISGISMTATSFIMNVLLGMAGVGILKASLDFLNGEKIYVKTLFYAFNNRSNRFIVIQLLFTVIKTALSTPEILLNRYAQDHEMSFLFYYGVLSGIMLGAIFITMLITLRLVWANYFLLEDYEMNAGEALKKSLAFTKGRTLEVLYLKVSFVGMFILAYLSMMVGFIYVRPYAEVSYAAYYMKYR